MLNVCFWPWAMDAISQNRFLRLENCRNIQLIFLNATNVVETILFFLSNTTYSTYHPQPSDSLAAYFLQQHIQKSFLSPLPNGNVVIPSKTVLNMKIYYKNINSAAGTNWKKSNHFNLANYLILYTFQNYLLSLWRQGFCVTFLRVFDAIYFPKAILNTLITAGVVTSQCGSTYQTISFT